METLDQVRLHFSSYMGVPSGRHADVIRTMKQWRSHWQNTDVSFSILLQFLTNETEVIEDWRKTVVSEISGWTGNSIRDFSQSSFWKSYENFDISIERALRAAAPSLKAVDLHEYQLGELHLATRIPGIDPAKARDFFVVDGQHKLRMLPSMEVGHALPREAVRTLSLRAIRAATKCVVDEIENAEISSVASLLLLTRDALSREIRQRVRWRISAKKTVSPPPSPEMTREHVLSFRLRTGNPPPFDSSERRTGAVAVPVIFHQASKVNYEPVCKQISRGNIRMAIFEGRRSTSFHRYPQAAASSRSGAQFAGRRRVRPYLQLGEGPRAAWRACRWQVVSDIRMDRRAGGFRDSARTTMNLQMGVR